MPMKMNYEEKEKSTSRKTNRNNSSTSFTAEVIRKFHRVKLKLRQKPDIELDDDDGPPLVRYKPDRLEHLIRTTKFSKEEIRCIYRAFKQECPTGAITEATFKSIYAKFFPLGDASQYAHYVFATLDDDKNGTITFGEFMLGLSIVMKGSLQDRLGWAFKLYDVNHDGFITKKEMLGVIIAIYNLMGDSSDQTNNTPEKHVDKIFEKLDVNHNGLITVDEFIQYCSTNESICQSFAIFDDLW